MDTATRNSHRLLATGAIAGPALFTVAWLFLGAVSPGYTMWDIVVPSYSPIAQPISGLGLGATGPWMNAAFIASAVLMMAGVLGIARAIPGLDRRARAMCIGLLALAPLGMAVDGVFTLESFFPHFLGYLLAIGSSVVSFFVVGTILRGVQGWRELGAALRAASPLTLILLVVAQATFDPTSAGANIGVAGLTERLVVTEVLAWFATMGWFALRRPAPFSLESDRGLLSGGMPALPVLPAVEARPRRVRGDAPGARG